MSRDEYIYALNKLMKSKDMKPNPSDDGVHDVKQATKTKVV